MPGNKRILVVDDSETNLFLIQAIFESEPDTVVELENDSRLALKRIKKGKPDLIILDIMMPYIDGYQLLQQISADKEIRDIPILVVSAKDDSESIKKANAYNIKAYLTKPIAMDDIALQVRSVFDTMNKVVKH